MTEQDFVVAMLPSGKIGKFPNKHIAKAMLLAKYHGYIFASADQVYEKLTYDKMCSMFEAIKEKHEKKDVDSSDWSELKSRIDQNSREASVVIFGLMEKYADSVFEYGKKGQVIQIKDKEYNPDEGQFAVRTYWVIYEPGKDPMKDASFVRLSPQARACMMILIESQKEPGQLMSEPTVFKLIKRDKKYIKTTQDKWRIFKYYRSALISQNFLRMTK